MTDTLNETNESNSGTPSVSGFYSGIVKQNVDPMNECRILVELPAFEGNLKEQWARTANLYATNEAGIVFTPEIGDEVLVGFLNQDITCPVVMGSLFSSQQVPPFSCSQQNSKKAIVTREKLRIEFDEEKKSIRITTPGQNQIEISDDEKSIQLSDQHQNQLVMNSNGITISSAKDLILKSKGTFTLDSTSHVNMKSHADFNIDGLNVYAKANVSFTAKGNASAELSASGQTVVKGAMVMIN